MVYTQAFKWKSPYAFMRNRIVRIVPIYWILTLFLVGVFILMPSVFRGINPTPEYSLASLFFLAHVLFDTRPLLFVGWTLEYEMLFYIVFAFGLFFSNTYAQHIVPIVIICALAIANVSDWIVLEFVFGIFVGLIVLRYKTMRFAPAAFVLSALFFISSIFVDYDAHRVIIYGLPAFVIVLSACYLPQLRNQTLIRLGDASYSIYLVQVFTIPGFYKFSSVALGWIPYDLLAVFCLTSSAVFGLFIYYFIERPSTHFLKSRFTQDTAKAPAVAG